MERLTGLDASFLYMETPQVQMHVGFALVLDPSDMPGGYSFQKISELIANRAEHDRVFRRRLVNVPMELHHPIWIDDPDFDIIHHVRHVALPGSGGREEFGAMVGRIYSTPLDRTRPLWEAWVIEGLEGGRFGLFMKFHHAAVDGVSGAALVMQLLQPSPEPDPLEPAPPRPPSRVPTDAEMIGFAMRSRMKAPAQFSRMLGQSVKFIDTVVKRRRDPEQDAGGTPLVAPRTHFNGSVSARRNLANARVSLKEVKRIKNAFGTTVNDVVLAIAGAILRRYLDARGSLPSAPLTAVCPMSVRSKEERGQSNNKVSAMFVCLYTNIEDPVDRLMEIHRTTKGAKEEHNALGAGTLQGWAELAGPVTFTAAVRLYSSRKIADMHRPIHNLVISNVPGPRFPLYLQGAQLEAIYPLGPVMEGAGLNLTLMSYMDAIDFSFLVDAQLVPDLWDLAKLTGDAINELSAAADAAIEKRAQAGTDAADGAAAATAATDAPKKRKPNRKASSKPRATRSRSRPPAAATKTKTASDAQDEAKPAAPTKAKKRKKPVAKRKS